MAAMHMHERPFYFASVASAAYHFGLHDYKCTSTFKLYYIYNNLHNLIYDTVTQVMKK